MPTRNIKGSLKLLRGGTIFLDEIGELPLPLQVKILRAIENKEIDRIGGKLIKVDVRVIAATNKNLEEAIKMGKFREDLYYRLNILNLYIPPLRERPEDIEPIANHFLKTFSQKYGKKFKGFTPDCLEAMCAHPWPGNVRQLIHSIERAVIYEKPFIQRALVRHKGNITKTAEELGISRKTLRDLIKKYKL